jgi:cytochrome c556
MNRFASRSTFSILAALLLTLAVAPLAVATESDPIQARQDAMEGVGDAMKALSAIAKKQAPFDAAVVQKNAKTIAGHLESVQKLFPVGSDKGGIETWAKAEIWANRADFDAKLKSAHLAAIGLGEVGDEAAYMPALGKLGNACKACHESFRRPKE